jgi:hypothetical protein
MNKNKPQKEQKGLSDKELIKKYESGKIPLKKIMNAMLKTPPPTQSEKTKKAFEQPVKESVNDNPAPKPKENKFISEGNTFIYIDPKEKKQKSKKKAG